MKILWFDLNSSYAHSSLALPSLHAQMTDNMNIEWIIVSATINENKNAVTARIVKERPDIIAATCWLFTHEALVQILSRCKAILPHSTIILGGPEFLGNNETFMSNNRFVDCVVRGEAEEIFPQLIGSYREKDRWKDIKGLCYIDSHGNYNDNGMAKVSNFAELKAPENSRFFNWDKPFIQLETTRGCFNTCSFCVSGSDKPVRTLSTEVIRERIKTAHSHGIKNIRVLDRTFNYNIKRAKELLSIFREFYPDIRFHLEIHPALLSDDFKKELQTLPKGLLHLEAGIQSLNEDVLEASRRHGKLSDAIDGLKFLCSLPNIETHADLIAGLPLYNLKQIFDDVIKLAEIGTDEIQLESLKLLPGTQMRKDARELGICHSPLPPYEVLCTNHISIDELETAMHLSRLLDWYYNTEAWQEITRKLMLCEKDFLVKFLEHIKSENGFDQPLSLEKRGIILYDFCKRFYAGYTTEVSISWIKAGMSLKKQPAENVFTKRQNPPEEWDIVYGEYRNSLRMCFLPDSRNNGIAGYWFGYSSEAQIPRPVFMATEKSGKQI